MAKNLAIILSSALLCGCASTFTGTLPLPLVCDTWTYPTITAEELECISSDAYERMVIRDTEKTLHIDELCAIIRNHNDSQEQ